MKTILIAPNSFKECADSVEITRVIEDFFADKNVSIIPMPLSDGGDGFLKVCVKRYELKIESFEIPSPFGKRNITSQVGFDSSQKVAYIESAKVLGLNLIPFQYRNPMTLNSKGLGVLLKRIHEERKGLEKVVIGIGGTGTNDLGLGAAAEFGLKLLDFGGKRLDILPSNYIKVSEIEFEPLDLSFEIQIVVDVDNPLIGENGASRSFATQKGASLEDVEIMEKGFENILHILQRRQFAKSLDLLNGAGGGLAAGLQIFFNAKLTYSSDFIFTTLGLKNISQEKLIVITGEGKFDKQSLMNKVPGVVINHFQNTSTKLFIICGSADQSILPLLSSNTVIIDLQKYFWSKEESIKNYYHGINLACEEIVSLL